MGQTFSCCPPQGGSYGSAKFYFVSGIVLLLSLSATVYYGLTMAGGMDMPGGWRMSMMWMRMEGQSWGGLFLMFLSMWTAMMLAMMLPSVMGKWLLLYRSLVWKRALHPGLSTGLVALGYFTVWTLFGFGVYALGIPFALAAMRWPFLSQAVPFLTGLALVSAGAYQFSPWKREGLRHSRNPLVYGYVPKRRKKTRKLQPEIMEDAGIRNSFLQGLRQGRDCAVCCAGSMLTLVALGAMNLLVMTAVTAVIALEKLLAQPRLTVKLTGFLGLVFGLLLIIRSII